jgi:hypothetical protein
VIATIADLFTRAGDDRSVSRVHPLRRALLHVHRYHRVGDDVFSAGSLYSCRCGVVRTGF